jgi:hypothetical protein
LSRRRADCRLADWPMNFGIIVVRLLYNYLYFVVGNGLVVTEHTRAHHQNQKTQAIPSNIIAKVVIDAVLNFDRKTVITHDL